MRYRVHVSREEYYAVTGSPISPSARKYPTASWSLALLRASQPRPAAPLTPRDLLPEDRP